MTDPNWNVTTIAGQRFLVIDVAQFRVPLDWDPSQGMFIAVAAPNAAALAQLPVLLQGAPGPAATFDSVVPVTALAYNDATPASASMATLSPGVYQLTVALHEGVPGPDGTVNLLGADDITGSPVATKILAVNATADGFEYVSQKVGDRWIPATVSAVSSGNASFTISPLSIPGQPNDWRPDVRATTVVTAAGSDCVVDLVARLSYTTTGGTTGSEAGGNIVASAFGLAGTNPPPHIITSAPPPGSGDTFDRVPAGASAILYLRTERQSGSAYYTTETTRTLYAVRCAPIP